jgi:hypothetical protein
MLVRLAAALEVTRLNKTLRVTALFAVLAVALLLSGCSLSQRKALTSVSQDELSAGGEPYFNVGGITYQIQESRQLNPYSDDVQYFAGLKGAQSIPGSDFWYGVFLWAKNQNKQSVATSDTFVLTDSDGDSYKPTALSANLNPFVWTSQDLAQDAIEPNPDSIASAAPTGGGLILFELPQSAYQNRPLTLHIYAPGATKAASVSLDL